MAAGAFESLGCRGWMMGWGRSVFYWVGVYGGLQIVDRYSMLTREDLVLCFRLLYYVLSSIEFRF